MTTQVEKTRENLTDHSYDGIQEYDNPTPGWWVAVFVFSVIFSCLYGVYYHFSPEAMNVKASYEAAVAEDIVRMYGKMGTLSTDEKSLVSYMQKKDYLARGEYLFKSRCTSCHGSEGAGVIGPNMTDDFYRNVKKISDIPLVIRNGANKNTMPAQTDLHPNDVALLAAYIATLRGKNLPGLPPYGEKIDPWPAPVIEATTTEPGK